MKYLAIDTSGAHLTVAAKNNEKNSVVFYKDCNLNHSVRLMDAVEEAVDGCGLDLSRADFLCACVGAGSFTGIRIGISAVKALSDFYKKPTVAVTAFDVIAYNIKKDRLLAVIDARHDHYYVCGYEGERVVLPPSFISADELNELSKTYAVAAKELAGHKHIAADVKSGLIQAAESKFKNGELGALNALYIRKSQAEENR